ncbi:hypothetical protein JTB14_024317 [Gonioctena quinquepunctata]|nr:hypothetical protein JTB14_024317 [Gonioctena quinquepunctata]
MNRILTISLFLLGTSLCDDDVRQPMYKYRYETEDIMKTASSNVPVHGYHVVEGGYYPPNVAAGGLIPGGIGGAGFTGGSGGYGGQYLGGRLPPIGLGTPFGTEYIGKKVAPIGLVPITPISYGGIGGPINGAVGYVGGLGGPGVGYGGQAVPTNGAVRYVGGLGYGGQAGPINNGVRYVGELGGPEVGYGGQGFIGGGAGLVGLGGQHGYGGEANEKQDFSEGQKNVNDERYEKNQGKKGEEVNYGDSGYSRGEVALKDVKGDSGYYSNVDGGKKIYEDGKEYNGGQHFNKEGKNGEEKTLKQGHKKGHKIKSFKTSHHKDENGKTEEYYDEAHDEGGNLAFNGQTGSFGENGASLFKGGNQEGKYASEENKKEGHFSNEHLVDKVDANQGKYGGNKFAGNEAVFGHKSGSDEQSLLGHQESNKVYKHNPFIIPFHNH